MARVETWVGCDLDKAVQVRQLGGFLFTQDNEGNLLGAKVTQDSEPVNLTGTVVGYAILADGQTVDITGDSTGIQNGNEAYIILPQLAYSVPGQISIVIKLTTADTITTLAAFCGYVYRSKTGNEVVPPGTPIPDLSTLEEAIRNANTAATAANTAAAAAENVDISMSQDGDVITITTTDRQGETKTATLTDQSEAVSELKSAVEQLDANVITESAGPSTIVSIADGADGMPMRSVEVAIEPVQDLHGYDSPWPAGGSVNKLPPLVDGTYTGNGITVVVKDGIATMSGTTTASGNAVIIPFVEEFTVPENSYIHALNSNANGGISLSFELSSSVSTTAVSLAPNPVNRIFAIPNERYSVKWDRLRLYIGDNTTVSGTISPMVCLTNAATDYTPYSNICPISGWTGAKVTRTGKNLLNPNLSAYTVGHDYLYLNGVVPKGQTARFTFTDKDTTVDLNGIAIGFQNGVGENGSQNATAYRWVMQNGTIKSDVSNIVTGGQVCTGVFIYPKTEAAFNAIFARYNVMVELGSTASAYIPYQGQTYEVTFPADPGTVYGGTLDVVTGKLVVDRMMVQIRAAINKSLDGNDNYFWYSSAGTLSIPVIKELNAKLISNRMTKTANVTSLSPDGFVAFYTNGIIRWKEQGTLTLSEYNSYLSEDPLEICYEIATPITYTLTPQEIKTLLSTNNIWSDAGNTAITYPADTKLYIDRKITEAVANALNA